MDGEALTLHAIYLDSAPLPASAYELDERGLTIRNAPDHCQVATDVSIHPSANTALMGLYQAGELLCSQCEPEAFRRITYYLDRPDVLAPFRVTLIGDADKYPVMLCNGNPVAEKQTDDGRRAVTWDDPFPKPSYLFAVVAGDITATHQPFTTAQGREVAINVWTTAAYRHRCQHTVATLTRAMAWDEAAYGLAYDLDVFNAVAVPQYTQGAMENKGLNIFNDRYALNDSATATDRDHRDGESMVAHEFFHNWSGNRVTCRDWFQLGLKEGFTTLREQEFIADQGWGAIRRIEDTQLMRSRQFAEDAGPMAHAVRPESYVEIENFYSDTVYSKGAEIFRMLRRLAGDAAFRAGVDHYFARHDGQAVTIEALVEAVGEAAGMSVEAFMGWFERAGTPSLVVTGTYDATAGVHELVVRQHPPSSDSGDEQPLPLPLAIGLLDASGTELPVRLADESDDDAVTGTRDLLITEHEQRFRLIGLTERPVVALLRDFSAPVRLNSDRTDADYAVLARHDPDPVAQWDAIQTLIDRCLDARLDGAIDSANEECLVAVMRLVLQRGSGDQGLDAKLLALPEPATLIAARPLSDVAALSAAHEGLCQAIARALHAQLAATFNANAQSPVPYAAEPGPVGQRALRDTCLAYLAVGEADGLARALAQYQTATNLTDTISALGLIADSEHPEREALLANFRARHSDNPLVLDKWLAIQARAQREDTLARVKTLMDDPFFSLAEPNRVRALVESFVTANPLRFHSTEGYRFLVDQVLALDPLNPALAAGLMRHLSNWHQHRPERGEAMRAAIEQVARAPGLSAATREVVDASLAV